MKILLEKWPKLCLIEAILGYLVLPHKQRLKAVQEVNDCYFAEGSHSSSGISLFHKGVSVKAVGWGGRGVAPFVILKTTLGECPSKFYEV